MGDLFIMPMIFFLFSLTLLEFDYPQLQAVAAIWCLRLDSYPMLSQVPIWSECKLSAGPFLGQLPVELQLASPCGLGSLRAWQLN